jgi:hypothetical protein
MLSLRPHTATNGETLSFSNSNSAIHALLISLLYRIVRASLISLFLVTPDSLRSRNTSLIIVLAVGDA